MKYVMFRVITSSGQVRFFPMIFFDLEVHKQVAESIERMKIAEAPGRWTRPQAVSAGMIYRDETGWHTTGYSDSLRMKPHPEDEHIMNTMSYGHGMGFSDRLSEVKERG